MRYDNQRWTILSADSLTTQRQTTTAGGVVKGGRAGQRLKPPSLPPRPSGRGWSEHCGRLRTGDRKKPSVRIYAASRH
jgi:hypothetical protein